MKVLHLSNTPLSNAPWNIWRCQELYSTAKPTLILGKKAAYTRQHARGTLWSQYDREYLVEIFEKTDVIHFHNFMFSQSIFLAYPELVEIAKKKPRLIQYHSPRVNEEASFEDTIADKTIKHAVIAQYHVRVYPECEFVVPNMVPIYDQEYMPAPGKWNDSVPTVSYSPSNATGKGWDDKGYTEVTRSLAELERKYNFNKDIIIKTPYEQCIARKRWAHIGIDEFKTGSYHLSSLEYASMGCVVIGRIDRQTEDAILKITKDITCLEDPLWYRTEDEEHFKLNMDVLLKLSVPSLEIMGSNSRKWMEKYWNPKQLVKKYEEVYRCL